MKFKRVWFFGGDKKSEEFDDWIEKYVADNGTIIEIEFSRLNNKVNGYWVENKFYKYLRDAKLAC